MQNFEEVSLLKSNGHFYFFTLSLDPNRCQSGWKYYNGSCYRAVTEPMSFSGAHLHCKKRQSDLVDIRSSAENTYVARLVPNEDLWIGFTDSHTEGIWVWTSNARITYTNFDHGQPDNHGNQDCALIWGYHKTTEWDDRDCHDKKCFVCKKGKLS